MKALASDKAAAIMIKVIEGNQFRVLVGSDARFLDFLYRLAPLFAVNFIVKQMAKLKKKQRGVNGSLSPSGSYLGDLGAPQ